MENNIGYNLGKPYKKPWFGINTYVGDFVNNGNGKLTRWINIIFLKKSFRKKLWSWNVGNGDDGIRSGLNSFGTGQQL